MAPSTRNTRRSIPGDGVSASTPSSPRRSPRRSKPRGGVSAQKRDPPVRKSKLKLAQRGFLKRHNPPDAAESVAAELLDDETVDKSSKTHGHGNNNGPAELLSETSAPVSGVVEADAVPADASKASLSEPVNDVVAAISSPARLPDNNSFASPQPRISDDYAEFGSPKAQAILAQFKGSIENASDASSSDDESYAFDDVDESFQDKKDLAADEPGPSSPNLRILRTKTSPEPPTTPNSASTTQSEYARNAYNAESRNELGLHTYIYEPLDACELRDFSKTLPAVSNGNCGIDAITKTLQRSLADELQYDTTLKDELGSTFECNNYFRFELRRYMEDNYIEFLTSSDPVFVDQYGQPSRDLLIKLNSKGHVLQSFLDADGNPCSNLDLIMDRIHHSDYFDSLKEGQFIKGLYWVDFKTTLPWVSKKYQQSFICYDPDGRRNDMRCRMTYTYYQEEET